MWVQGFVFSALVSIPLQQVEIQGDGLQARRQLELDYPGLIINEDFSRILSVGGRPMAGGETPEQSVESWLSRYGAVFGSHTGRLIRSKTHSQHLSKSPYSIFVFEQKFGSISVDHGRLGLVVHRGRVGDILNPVVLVNARLANGAAEQLWGEVTGREAEETVRSESLRKLIGHLQDIDERKRLLDAPDIQTWSWANPQDPQVIAEFLDRPAQDFFSSVKTINQVIWIGQNEPARLAWKIEVKRRPEFLWTVFLDAKSRRILEVRSEITRYSIQGHIAGEVTPGPLPSLASNPSQIQSLALARVNSGEVSSYADQSGNFSIEVEDGSSNGILTSQLESPWVHIYSEQGPQANAQVSYPPFNNLSPRFLANNQEYLQSQNNIFYYVNKLHTFLNEIAPDFLAINAVNLLTGNANRALSCNATFDPSDMSINFYHQSDECVNTAYQSVIDHEYGHYIVNRLNLLQLSFGEGFADTTAMLHNDDSIMGPHFWLNGDSVRDPVEADITYPCNGGNHYCGQVLGAFWWELRMLVGLETARSLWANWLQITSGGNFLDAAHPTTVLEVLAVDDDDADLLNGTPHGDAICEAARRRGLPCPAPSDYSIEFENYSDLVTPQRSFPLRGQISPIGEPGSPVNLKLVYQINRGAWNHISYDLTSTSFEVFLPPVNCLSTLQFFFLVQAPNGRVTTIPTRAPVENFQTAAAVYRKPIFTHIFSSPDGWMNIDGGGLAGAFAFGTPQGLGMEPTTDSPHDMSSNISCWLTAPGAGPLAGTTSTASPLVAVGKGDGLEIKSDEYLQRSPGSFANLSQIIQWNSTTTYGSATFGTDGLWQERRHVQAAAGNGTFRLRYTASSPMPDTTAEAAFDNVRASRLFCQRACVGDFDLNGTTSVSDIYEFIAAWVSHSMSADSNLDGNLGVQDIYHFFGAWAAGCEN